MLDVNMTAPCLVSLLVSLVRFLLLLLVAYLIRASLLLLFSLLVLLEARWSAVGLVPLDVQVVRHLGQLVLVSVSLVWFLLLPPSAYLFSVFLLLLVCVSLWILRRALEVDLLVHLLVFLVRLMVFVHLVSALLVGVVLRALVSDCLLEALLVLRASNRLLHRALPEPPSVNLVTPLLGLLRR